MELILNVKVARGPAKGRERDFYSHFRKWPEQCPKCAESEGSVPRD